MSLSNHIYANSPVCIQNILISLYGYKLKRDKYGGVFKAKLDEFKKREAYTSQQWRDYQTVELRKLLSHAFLTVPYYNNLYKKHGFSVAKVSKFEIEDLKKLPYLEKEDFRKFGKNSLLSSKRKKGHFISSSGSTGTPTNTYFSNEFLQTWTAVYEARVRNWAGVSLNMRRGMIGGRKIMENKETPPYYRFNIAEGQTYFSAYHISKETVNNYAKGIIKNDIDYMVGYAMSNYFLADLIVKQKIEVPKLKAVLTSSEKLSAEMREIFFKAYGCKTFDAYSGVEACGLISENKSGDFLFSPDTGCMEVVDNDGNEVSNGEEGEVIATGLLNFDQPLIRYRIGDRVKLSKNQQTKSGLEMLKIDEISGRVEDVIYGSDGRKMVRFHGLYIDVEGLLFGQIIQNSIRKFNINLVVDRNYSKQSELIIKERLRSQLGESLSVDFCYLEEFPKNENGKFQPVISNL